MSRCRQGVALHPAPVPVVCSFKLSSGWFSGFFCPSFFLPLPLSVPLPSRLPSLSGSLPSVSPLFRASFRLFSVPLSVLSNFLRSGSSFLPLPLSVLLPSRLPSLSGSPPSVSLLFRASFRLVFRAIFRSPLFRFPFRFRFRLVSGFFRIFSNPENDTDETLTTSGVSHGDFC